MFYIDHLYKAYRQYLSQMESPTKETFKLLAELHAHSAGMKAISSYNVEHFGEKLKQSCGGHGYLYVGGLVQLHRYYGFGIVTAEGDNVVMLQ